MDNYEINILRRDGNWKKVNPNDLLLDASTQETLEKIQIDKSLDTNNNHNFINYINEVNSIITQFETLENEKNKLKDQLKFYEHKFQSKKTITEKKIKTMSKEVEMLDKTIGLIKNLKSF